MSSETPPEGPADGVPHEENPSPSSAGPPQEPGSGQPEYAAPHPEDAPPQQQGFPPPPGSAPQQAFPPQPGFPPPQQPGYPGYPPQPGYAGVDPSAPFGRHPLTGEPFSDKSKVTAGLLQLFLGGVGAGRWYLGDTGIALAQLFTCGGCGIWALIDAIQMLTGNTRDKYGRRLRD